MDIFKNDFTSTSLKFEFVETNSEVDGKHILAKVKGPFFVPDGVSRNNRFYTKQLWEKCLSSSEVTEKLKSRTMFGTIGHDTELNDKSLQEGKISHIVTSAYIDESTGQGIGEALILNTPSGQILNTVLRAGSEVFVSSRADGKFKGTKNGIPLVDEDTYDLKGWDFVLSPGFMQANPKIAESLNDIKGDFIMENKVIERLSEENGALKEKLMQKDQEVVSKIKEAIQPVQEENSHIKGELHEAEKTINELRESLNSLTEEKAELEEKLNEFDTLGESFDEIKEALEFASSFMESVHEEFGTFDQIKEALTVAAEMKESLDTLGTVDEIKAALEIADSLLEEKSKKEYMDKVKELADKLDVKAEAIDKMMKKGMTEEEIEELCSEMMDKDDKEDKEMKEKSKKMAKDEDLGEALKEKTAVPRAVRLMKELSR